MSENHDCGGDAAAYVLGALDADERQAFSQHMSRCIVCRDEVAALEQVVDALPMAAPQYAVPKELRGRVLGAIRAEPRQQPEPVKRRFTWPSLSLGRPALAGAMAVLAVVAVLAGVLLSGGSSGTQVFRAQIGSAEVRLAEGHGELIVNHLAQPPAGHIYEVWLKRAGRPPAPTSTLFSVTSSGHGDVGLPGNLQGVQQIMVTPERAGGSLVPTHPPVIVTRLS